MLRQLWKTVGPVLKKKKKKKGIKLPTCGPIISPLDVCPQKPESRDLNRYL